MRSIIIAYAVREERQRTDGFLRQATREFIISGPFQVWIAHGATAALQPSQDKMKLRESQARHRILFNGENQARHRRFSAAVRRQDGLLENISP